MARGRLRVMLGAAPGVGKTFTMLEEGRRLQAEGRDVVVAIVETHGRAATASLRRGARGDPAPLGRAPRRHPRRARRRRGARPQARSSPSSTSSPTPTPPAPPHAKRWEDVEQLLDAGIDVISTVNIQHIESLNDVVQQITGVPQRETIPDAVLRRADQVELVDLAPAALRDRLSQGLVYPAARVDAALSNYFRLGNLTALRELALLWLADEVDTALRAYRARAGHRRAVGGARAHRGRAHRRTGGRHPAAPRRAHRAARRRRAALRGARRDAGGPRRPRRRRRCRRSEPWSSRSAAPFTRSWPSRCRPRWSSSRAASTRPSWSSASAGAAASKPSSAAPGTSSSVIRLSGDIDVHIVSHVAGRDRRPAARRRRALAAPAAHRIRPDAGRPPAADLDPGDVPQRRVDHQRRARVPAVHRGRRPGRRDLARAARGRAQPGSFSTSSSSIRSTRSRSPTRCTCSR